MKKIIGFIVALLLVPVTFGGETNLFPNNDLGINAFATFQNSQHWGYGIGVSYYVDRHFGVSVSTSRQDFDFSNDKFFQNLTTVGLFRLPVTANLAPYIAFGQCWDIVYGKSIPVAGLGVEYRFSKRLGCFVEGSYGFGTWDKWESPKVKDIGVRGGFRFAFW